MDLGFAGLIEKIEERFGKGVTSALMLALVLLIFAWTIDTIFSLYVSGIALWEENGESAILGLAKIILVHLILIVTAFGVIYAIFWRVRDRAVRRGRQEIEDYGAQKVQEIEDYGEKRAEELREFGAEQVSKIHSVARMYDVEPKNAETAEEKD